jgi:hypothetical protein
MLAHRHRLVALALLSLVAVPVAADTIHDAPLIDSHVTWYADGNDHVIIGTVTVAEDASLTIEDGCVLRFDSAAALMIHGGLTCAGTAGAGILMTSRDAGELWHGVRFSATGGGTLTYCTIEHAGQYTSSAGIYADGAMPTVEHCTIRSCRYGIYVEGVVEPTLAAENTIADNAVAGLHFHDCTDPSVSNQVLSGHATTLGAIAMIGTGRFHLGPGNVATDNSWGLSIDAGSFPDAASAGNVPVDGNTNADGLQVHAGSTAAAVTWPDVGADYVVTASPTIAAGGSLTIEDGCTVKFGSGVQLMIHGEVVVDGSETEGVLLTRRAAGVLWHGLRLSSSASGIVRHATIEYASQYTSSAGIHADGTMPTVEHCTLRDNRHGLYCDEVVSPTLAVENTLTDNAVAGLYFHACSDPDVSNQVLTGHSGTLGAIAMIGTGRFHLGPGNAATGNSWGLSIDAGSYPDAASAGNIPVAGNTNADGLQVHGGSTDAAVTWHPVGADYIVTMSPTFTASASLTIADGCTVKFGSGLQMLVYGEIQVTGTDAAGVLLTRRHDGVAWHGLRLNGAGGRLDHCTIEHASQYTSSAGLLLENASPELVDCTFRGNWHGLYLDASGPSLVRCSVTENTDYGMRLVGASVPAFGSSLAEWNDIHDNAGGALERDFVNGSEDIAARYVYWGTIVPVEVEDRIHHEPDDDALGFVQYAPWTDAVHENTYGVVAVPDEDELPRAFAFAGCAPNPFNPATVIRYDLPRTCAVELVIHDVAGRRVATLVDGVQSAGFKSVRWDARGLASGTYVCSIRAGEFRRTRKMMVVR